jgi:hypothetical protein
LKVNHKAAKVSIVLTEHEALDLFYDLADADAWLMDYRSEAFAAELGATLEDAGLFPDDDNDPEPMGQVIPLFPQTEVVDVPDLYDPSVEEWRAAIRGLVNAAFNPLPRRVIAL